MAYDEGLTQRIRELVGAMPGMTEKKMFGGVGFILNGNMACGVSGDGLMARVGIDDYAAALTEPHVTTFGPAGREMRGWVLVTAPGIEADADLAAWVERGIAFAAGLSAK